MSTKNTDGVLVEWREKTDYVNPKDLEDQLIIAVRIRGNVNKQHVVKKTFELLRLHKKHHAVLLRATKPINGMLFKIKDFIAYGMINKDVLVELLKKKARLQGRKPLDIASLKSLTEYATFEELADALLSFKLEFKDIKFIVPVFRLHPAKGGFYKGIKKQYSNGGVLGFHGDDINRLLHRMI